jgi:hypothetical protein
MASDTNSFCFGTLSALDMRSARPHVETGCLQFQQQANSTVGEKTAILRYQWAEYSLAVWRPSGAWLVVGSPAP